MQYIWQHIRTIIGEYQGALPLSHFLKSYLKQHPKLGSRDRRILSEMAYAWYRFSKGFPGEISFEQKLSACIAIGNSDNKHFQRFLPEGELSFALDPSKIFPFEVDLSEGMTKEAWLASIAIQPDLFIRLRNKAKVLAILRDAGIDHKEITNTCLALPNGAAIDKLLPQDSYAVQDASSQQTGTFFQPQANEQWWDCCSGAGGKSLLLTDKNPKIKLTVSDKRENILHNLAQRFKQYGLPIPQQYLLDMSNEQSIKTKLAGKLFDSIICDVPCTGSGTWARTPEQLYYFNPEALTEMQTLQTGIATNATKYLKRGGTMFYITCSVFKKENENVVAELVKSTGLKLQSQQIINGIGIKADIMFIAVLKRD